MNRILITLWVGKDLGYFIHSRPFHERYADKVGADYMVWEAEEAKGNIFSLKFDIFRWFEESNYDQMCYIDADIMPNPAADDIFEEIESGIYAAPDMGIPNGPHGSHIDYKNAGVIAAAKEAITDWRSRTKDFSGFRDIEFFSEQNYFNDTAEAKPLGNNFNWMAPQFMRASLGRSFIHFVGDHKERMRCYGKIFRVMEECL